MIFSKHKDIEAVMIKARSHLETIDHAYQKSLNERIVPDSLLVDVKDCIGNLRSTLDYLWCKVPGVGSGAHFPVANGSVDFLNKTKGIDPKYISLIEVWQSYNGDPWLLDFNLMRNKNTHLTLVPQIRTETKEFSVRGKEASVTMRGVTFQGPPGSSIVINIGGASVPIDTATEFPIDVPGVDITRTIWVDFLFDGSSISRDFPSGISVLPFLKESLRNVAQIVSDVERISI